MALRDRIHLGHRALHLVEDDSLEDRLTLSRVYVPALLIEDVRIGEDIRFENGIEVDACMVTLGSIIVWMAVKTNKERKIQRWAGALLLLVYAAYLTYRLMIL